MQRDVCGKTGCARFAMGCAAARSAGAPRAALGRAAARAGPGAAQHRDHPTFPEKLRRQLSLIFQLSR